MALRRIAVLGGTGTLGRVLVQKLLEAGDFDIRLIVRQETVTDHLDPSITTVIADRSSASSLADAFTSVDVAIDALADRAPFEDHIAVFNAALAAGVPRYVPTQWGNTPQLEGMRDIPFFKAKFVIADLMEKAAQEGKLTFTSFSGGPWLEYIMEFPTLLSVPQRTFHIHEYPDFVFGISSRELFGDALVAALRKPQETENKHLHVDLIRLSTNRALQLAREAFPTENITVVEASYEERYLSGLKKVFTGVKDKLTFADVLSKWIFDPVANKQSKLDNDWLGLKTLSDDEFKNLLREAAESKRYEEDAIAWRSISSQK